MMYRIKSTVFTSLLVALNCFIFPTIAENTASEYRQCGSRNFAQNIYHQAIKLDTRYRNSLFLNHLQQAAFTQEQINTVKQILFSL